MDIEKLKFPIGEFQVPESIDSAALDGYIATIAAFPGKLHAELQGMDDAQLDTPYRPEGWTIRQVVHHCADSHLNALSRFKLALTEENPTIRPYFEARWAELPDSSMPVSYSLDILQGLHARWAHILRSLTPDDWKKTFFHPEHQRTFRLDEMAANYAWHCDHHFAHVTLVSRPAK